MLLLDAAKYIDEVARINAKYKKQAEKWVRERGLKLWTAMGRDIRKAPATPIGWGRWMMWQEQYRDLMPYWMQKMMREYYDARRKWGIRMAEDVVREAIEEEGRAWILGVEVPEEELKKNIKPPKAGVCYAQCPNIYFSFSGKTISESSLPVLVFERTVPSDRYESGGRHGIERVDEFHRIEIVYIGTKEQLLELREKLIERYKHVFNNILELEWRMAQVTPFYMQQAGIAGHEEELSKGTIDFEAWLPYRGDRSKEWLEFQNISIVGDKYTRAFNIKGQRSQLWSGCSGVGLERWVVAFLSQKGIDPEKWPPGFKKYLPQLPPMPEFL